MKKIRDEVSLGGKLETITAMDWRRAPGEVLASVALGKRFIITKQGRPVAMLCQPPCDLSEDWFPKRARPEVQQLKGAIKVDDDLMRMPCLYLSGEQHKKIAVDEPHADAMRRWAGRKKVPD